MASRALFHIAAFGVILTLNDSAVMTRDIREVGTKFQPPRLVAILDSWVPLVPCRKIWGPLRLNNLAGPIFKHFRTVVGYEVLPKVRHQTGLCGPVVGSYENVQLAFQVLAMEKVDELE